MAVTTLAAFGTFLAETFGSYFISHKLDRLFSNKEEFITELSKVVNSTIEEYSNRYPQADEGRKFSFYKSQKIIDELLKYRILSGEKYELGNLEKALSEEKNVIPPTQEQIKNFYNIFVSQIQANDKLRELEIKETFEEEIFNISYTVRNLDSRIDNIISTYNGDLEAQWRDRLKAYVETLKQFKPQTALNLLHKLEESFENSQNKPDDKFVALIKYQEVICFSLLGKKESYPSFIKAYNKDKTNLKHKEQAAFSYFKLKDMAKAQTLRDEILQEDEYNIVAWALILIMSNEESLKETVDSIPVYVRKNRRFQCLLFNHYISIDKFCIIQELKNWGVIPVFPDINFIEVDVDSFNEGIYIFNLLIGTYIQEYNYADFVFGQFEKNDLFTLLNEQIKRIINKVRNSEISDKWQRLYFFDALVDYILTGDKTYALKMKDYLSDDKTADASLVLICANILQIEKYEEEAIKLIDNFQNRSFELNSLKVFIYLKNKKIDDYLKAVEELYRSTQIVESRIIQAYIQYIFALKKYGHLNAINPEIFYLDKVFFEPKVADIIRIIVHVLTNNSLNPYKEEFAELADYFKDNSSIILAIANTYYYANEDAVAVQIYRKHLDLDKESIYLYHYLLCLYRLKSESELLLNILKKWRENFSFNPDLLGVEYNLSAIILDWKRCLEIVEYALSIEPNLPGFVECRLIALDKLNDERVEKYIDIYLEYANKDLNLLPKVIDILIKKERLDQVLELLYEYYSDDNSLIQTLYFNAALRYSQACDKGILQQTKMLEYETVERGHFVKYSLNGKVKFVEVIDSRDRKSLIEKLLGRKKGESFEMKRTISNQTDKIVVLRIMDKYLYAHDKILEKANDPYSGLPMEAFHFERSDENIVEVFKRMFGEYGDEREKFINGLMEDYYRGKATYSEIILQACHNDYFGGYFHLIHFQKGIVTVPKLVYDRLDIPCDKPYIIDFSSLPILYQLSDVQRVQYPDKFYISKHLVEILKNRIKQLKTEPKSELSIVTTTQQVSKIVHTEEEHNNTIKYIENLFEWVELNCIEKVSVRVADMRRSIEAKDFGIDGDTFWIDCILNTILIREDEDAILISDDLFCTKSLGLPLSTTVSTEVYAKRILGNEHPALKEFLTNK
ncbi:MAG: hypothetical protein LUE98_20475 [Tannerellaceae bacterium]|nr:hypothetical protein [Tannerellaceae bacterium]